MPAIDRLRGLVVLPLLLLTVLATTFVTAPEAQAATKLQKIRTATSVARNQIGDPYSYGAAGPSAFDCSGLIYFSYRKAGFTGMPRTSSAQAGWLKPIRKKYMRKGDLMYFYDGGGIYHAAIFLYWDHGDAVMLHSPYSGAKVRRERSWTSSWVGRTLRGM